MIKLDKKALLEEAERDGQVYRIKSGWKKYFIFAGVLMCLLVLTLPLGIWFFFIAKNARLGIAEKGFVLKWMGTLAVAWEDIDSFVPVPLHFHASGGGLVGALAAAAASAAVAAKTEGLKGPLQFKIKDKWGTKMIPAHAIENSVAMAKEMEKRTGLTIFPPEEEAGEADQAS